MVPIFLDIGKVKSLMAFVNKEKTLPQMDYILFDLDGCGYSQEHILSAVQQIRRFSIAGMVFLSPAGEDTDLLYGCLANFRLSNLIAVDSRTDVAAELRACFEEAGGNHHRRFSAMANALARALLLLAAATWLVLFNLLLGLIITGALCFTLYTQQEKKLRQELDGRRQRIERELPQFASTIRQSLNSTKTIVAGRSELYWK